MTLFGIGNIQLKTLRKGLKRTYRVGWMTILVAILATILGMLKNVVID
jgi:predicted neutral ceramidase superfamily lipid hydrolase